MNIIFHNVRRPYARTLITRMSRTNSVTDLLQGLMAHMGIVVYTEADMSVIRNK